MSERTWFPPGLSDGQPDPESQPSAIYVDVSLPSASLARASHGANAAVAQTCDSAFASNAAVATPACGYGGIVFVIGSRMLRGLERVAAGAVLSMHGGARYYAPSELRYDSSRSAYHYDARDDWFRTMLSQFSGDEAYVPAFPLRIRERERLFPPPWQVPEIEDAHLRRLARHEG